MSNMLDSTNKHQPLFKFQSRKQLNQFRWCVSIVMGSILFGSAIAEEPYFVALLVGILSVVTCYFCSCFIFTKKHVRIKNEDQENQPG